MYGAPTLTGTNFTSLPGAQVGSGVPAANIAAGSLGASVLASSFPVSGASAGSYTNTNLTVNAQGIITAASNGTGGGGGSSLLAVQQNAVNISSPTVAINFLSPPFNVALVNTSTAQVTLSGSSVTLQGPIVSSITLSAMYGAPTLTGTNFTSLPGAQVGSGVPAANIASGSLGSSVIASSITLAAMFGAPTLTGTNITGIVGSNVGSGVPAANIASGSLGASVIASSITLAAMYGAPTLTGTNITSIPASSINSGSLGASVIASSISLASMNPLLASSSTWTAGQTYSSYISIPNGAGKTVSSAGQLAIDTNAGQLVMYDGSSAKVVASSTHSFTVTISSGIGWNSLTLPVWRAPIVSSVTITEILAESLPSNTTVQYQLSIDSFTTVNTLGGSVFSVGYSSASDGGYTTTSFKNNVVVPKGTLVLTTPSSGAGAGTPSAMTLTVYYLENLQ